MGYCASTKKVSSMKVFICSPFSGDTEVNICNARMYARKVALLGHLPFAPHLLFPQFLDDGIPEERQLGLRLGLLQMAECDELWVFGHEISAGMSVEIEKAKKTGIPIRLFDKQANRLSKSALQNVEQFSTPFHQLLKNNQLVWEGNDNET